MFRQISVYSYMVDHNNSNLRNNSSLIMRHFTRKSNIYFYLFTSTNNDLNDTKFVSFSKFV